MVYQDGKSNDRELDAPDKNSTESLSGSESQVSASLEKNLLDRSANAGPEPEDMQTARVEKEAPAEQTSPAEKT